MVYAPHDCSRMLKVFNFDTLPAPWISGDSRPGLPSGLLLCIGFQLSFLISIFKNSISLDYIKGQLCLEIDQGLIIQGLFCELLKVELE